VLVFAVLSPLLLSMVHTCKPPYEQLLVGMVVGGMLFLCAGVLVIVLPLSCCHLCPCCHASIIVDMAISTCDPTCEQLLAVRGWVLCCLGVVLVVVVVVVVVTLSW